MLNIQVGHDQHIYYVGFEPRLDGDQLAMLPNPYINGGSVETAGWPSSAIVSAEKDPATVLGIYKVSLKLAPVVLMRFSTQNRRMEYGQNPPPEKESLLNFLSGVLSTFDNSVLDPHFYRVDTSDGIISFDSQNGHR